MKKIILLILALTLGASALLALPRGKSFTIAGEIAGLMKGDTLRFQRVFFGSNYHHELAFEVVLERNGGFVYKGVAQHEMMLLMSLKPADGRKLEETRGGMMLFVRGGDKLRLESEVDRLYYSTIYGGIYDNPLLAEVTKRDHELGYQRTSLLRKAESSRRTAEKNSPEMKEAVNAFNDFHKNNHVALKQVDSLYNVYYATKEGEELSVINSLRRVTYLPIEELRSSWERLSKKNKKSFHAKRLHEYLLRMERLKPGCVAPEFTLVREDSTTLRSSDWKGKYLLIYHFGMCPGSIQIDPEVTALYERVGRDSLCVIGVSSIRKQLQELYEETTDEEQFMGMNLKERLHSMTNHPYEDFDMSGGQNDLSELFQFGGLPYFVFISPEGKLIDRGFHKVFDIAKAQFK